MVAGKTEASSLGSCTGSTSPGITLRSMSATTLDHLPRPIFVCEIASSRLQYSKVWAADNRVADTKKHMPNDHPCLETTVVGPSSHADTVSYGVCCAQGRGKAFCWPEQLEGRSPALPISDHRLLCLDARFLNDIFMRRARDGADPKTSPIGISCIGREIRMLMRSNEPVT